MGEKKIHILEAEEHMKNAKGKASLLKFARGEAISPKEGIYAKCYDCQSYYEDITGERDCGVRDCPLYPFFPYSSDRSQNLPSLRMKERIEKGDFRSPFFAKKETQTNNSSDEDEDGDESGLDGFDDEDCEPEPDAETEEETDNT